MGTDPKAVDGTASPSGPGSILLIDDGVELGQAMREYFARRQIELEVVSNLL